MRLLIFPQAASVVKEHYITFYKCKVPVVHDRNVECPIIYSMRESSASPTSTFERGPTRGVSVQAG